MSVTVQEIENILNELAPMETAEGYDNVGALVGKRSQEAHKILVALDCTMDVVKEALHLGAEVIVTHHPLLFHARKNMLEEDVEGRILCEMIRRNLALVSAHTNLDQTAYSGSACCARLLSLQNIRQEGYLFLGELETPLTAAALEERITQALNFPTRRYGDEQLLITTLSIGGGACDEEWSQAKALGAQAFLTGEVRHHNALAASMDAFVLYDGGHYGTEAPLVPMLRDYLQNRMDAVQYKVTVYASQCAPFGRV